MEHLTFPATMREMAEKIRDCAESCRESGLILTPERLAYLANWRQGYAALAMQTYAGLLNDSRRGLR